MENSELYALGPEGLAFPTDEDFIQVNQNQKAGEVDDTAAETLKTEFNFENYGPFHLGDRNSYYGFKSQPKPWLPPKILSKIEKMKRTSLRNKELVSLLEEIANISIDFYGLKRGNFVALRLDGRIAESAKDEFDLLFKIQGKKFDVPVFVWKVGSNSFAGWKVWRQK